ncbi:MAG: alpha/beta fold hydrolase [Nitriliruptorales bacterium]
MVDEADAPVALPPVTVREPARFTYPAVTAADSAALMQPAGNVVRGTTSLRHPPSLPAPGKTRFARPVPIASSIRQSDNPDSIRQRKYLTGTHFLVDAVENEVARTPRTLVWAQGKARLYRYGTGANDRLPVPLLLVYALILRPYILDLVPRRSLVEALVARGFDVYLLDWGVPGKGDAELGLDDYVASYLPAAVCRIMELSSAPQVSMIGYCQGGTIATTYAGLFPESVRNLVLLGAPIIFDPPSNSEAGFWTIWARQLTEPEYVTGHTGNVPANVLSSYVRAATRTLVTMTGTSNVFALMHERLQRDEALRAWLAVCRWVDDAVPFPGRAFRQWIRSFYQGNLLASGRLRVRGRTALSQISASVLNIAGSQDSVTPLWQSGHTTDLIGSEDTQSLIVDAGHVGLVVGPNAKQDVWEPMMAWLVERSEP